MGQDGYGRQDDSRASQARQGEMAAQTGTTGSAGPALCLQVRVYRPVAAVPWDVCRLGTQRRHGRQPERNLWRRNPLGLAATVAAAHVHFCPSAVADGGPSDQTAAAGAQSSGAAWQAAADGLGTAGTTNEGGGRTVTHGTGHEKKEEEKNQAKSKKSWLAKGEGVRVRVRRPTGPRCVTVTARRGKTDALEEKRPAAKQQRRREETRNGDAGGRRLATPACPAPAWRPARKRANLDRRRASPGHEPPPPPAADASRERATAGPAPASRAEQPAEKRAESSEPVAGPPVATPASAASWPPIRAGATRARR
ncbi:hypothetical protein CDD83_8768 [Cordyceps sp. RAO-2017]|nr:hypothetical protein CDD83_8768 [Cordyceps sp. RAO-2017]